jgi:hypothetical protein
MNGIDMLAILSTTVLCSSGLTLVIKNLSEQLKENKKEEKENNK